MGEGLEESTGSLGGRAVMQEKGGKEALHVALAEVCSSLYSRLSVRAVRKTSPVIELPWNVYKPI